MGNNRNRKLKRILIIGGVVLGILVVLIVLPQVFKLIFSPERGYLPLWANYDKTKLEQKYGIDIYSFHETDDIGWLKGATEYYYTGEKEKLYHYMNFYLFDSKRAAVDGMDKFRERYFGNGKITFEGNRLLEGRLGDADDADVCMFIYQSRNMIITCEAAYKNYIRLGTTEDDVNEKNNSVRKRYEQCKKAITETFQ